MGKNTLVKCRGARIAAALFGAILSTESFAATTTTIDFDAAPDGPVASFTLSGVTFSAVGGGGQLVRQSGPNGTSSIFDFNFPIKELRADIAGGATFVSVDLGDFNSDSENLFLEVYNSSNALLDSVSLFNPDTSEIMRTLSLANPNIAYAFFGARNAVNGSSVYADNLTFTQVPESTTATLALIGGMSAVLTRRRRRR